jgi:putative glutathione S-transferase
MLIGFFCPFAHRVNLVRHLKGLQEIIPLSVVRPYPKGEEGFRFPADDTEYGGSTVDPLYESKFLSDLYFKSDPEYKGRFFVPLLWDKKTTQAVNNVSPLACGCTMN